MPDFAPAAVLEMVQRQVALLGRTSSTGAVRVPDLAAVMAVAPSALVPTEVAAPPLVFQESGYVIAMYGQERKGTPAAYAATELRVNINGERDLFTAGDRGPAYMQFLALFGPSLNWWPLTRRVRKNDLWQIFYRNFDTANTAIPSVSFAFLSDAQVAKMGSESQR